MKSQTDTSEPFYEETFANGFHWYRTEPFGAWMPKQFKMKSRYVYLVIQDDRRYPCRDHNDTQRHVLGVHSSSVKAHAHLNSCKQSRFDMGYTVIRDNRYDFKLHDGRIRSVYMHHIKHGSSELIIDKVKVS